MIGFLGANGFRFMIEDDVRCANHMLAVLRGEATEGSFTDVLRTVIAAVREWP